MTKITLVGRLTVDDKVLAGPQLQLLFAYFILHRDRWVPRGELIDALWAEQLPEDPSHALSDLLWRLKLALGYGILEGEGEPLLRLALPNHVWIDTEVASAEAHRMRSALKNEDYEVAGEAARAVLELTGAGLLPGADAPWLKEEQRRIEDLELEALELVALTKLAVGGAAELAEGEAAARNLITRNPYREGAYRLLMELQAARGNIPEALQVFDGLRNFLREALGSNPSPETRKIHQRLLKDGPTAADSEPDADQPAVVTPPKVAPAPLVPAPLAPAPPAQTPRERRRLRAGRRLGALVAAVTLSVGVAIAGLLILPPVSPPAKAPVAVAREVLEAINTDDRSRLRELHGPDSVYEELATGRRAQGPQEIVDVLAKWKRGVPDVRGHITNIVSNGDRVALEVSWVGTQTGPLELPPQGTIRVSNQRAMLPAGFVMRIQHGKVQETHHFFDRMTLLEQIRAVPKMRPTRT